MRFRIPEIFMGSLLTVAVFSIGLLFSSNYPVQTTQNSSQQAATSNSDRAKKPDGEITGSAWLTRDAAGFFTFALVVVGGLQAYLFVQQLRLMRQSLAPAKAAAIAAAAAAQHIPTIERAYLFLGLELKTDFDEFRHSALPRGLKGRPQVTFGFRNHGKTPAIVTELHATAKYWPLDSGWPTMAEAIRNEIPAGLVIGEEPVDGYSVKFPLSKEELDRVEGGAGYVLFWGKVVYLDVFQVPHETGWCRAYQRGETSWRFAGGTTLNYYS